MSSNVADYIALITSWHSTRPNFVATVGATVQPVADVQGALASLPSAFDIDLAVGVQLDHIGERVGLSRAVPVPLPNLFFSFGDAARGFGLGIWKGRFDTTSGLVFLDDETYRRLLRSKILANSWDGTVAGAQAALDAFFDDPDTFVFIEDNGETASPRPIFSFGDASKGFGIGEWDHAYFAFGDPARGFGLGRWRSPLSSNDNPDAFDMSMTIAITGKIPPLLDLAILGADLIPIKPAGVEVDYAITSAQGAPVFGFGVENEFISGFGGGAWGVTPAYALANPIS